MLWFISIIICHVYSTLYSVRKSSNKSRCLCVNKYASFPVFSCYNIIYTAILTPSFFLKIQSTLNQLLIWKSAMIPGFIMLKGNGQLEPHINVIQNSLKIAYVLWNKANTHLIKPLALIIRYKVNEKMNYYLYFFEKHDTAYKHNYLITFLPRVIIHSFSPNVK